MHPELRLLTHSAGTLSPFQDTKLIPRDQVVYRATSTGGILVDVQTGACFNLNPVGAYVWECLTSQYGSLEEIVAAIQAKYDVALEVAASDVSRICSEMLAAGVLQHPEEPAC